MVVTDVALLSFLVEKPLVAEGTFLENGWVELKEVTPNHQGGVVHHLETDCAG